MPAPAGPAQAGHAGPTAEPGFCPEARRARQRAGTGGSRARGFVLRDRALAIEPGAPGPKCADSADAEDVPYAPAAPVQPAPPGPAPARGQGRQWGGAGRWRRTQKKPALDFLFRSKREPQPEAFDSVWPQRGGQRRSEEPREESGGPAAEAPIDRAFLAERPASAPEETRPAAILKSGVVDGMAYTLYADGSIEAQLPQGTVRFGSIAELRAHIENNS